MKFAFAKIVDVNNKQIIELSKTNIPIIDIRRSSEWDQTGVVPESILLSTMVRSIYTINVSPRNIAR